MSEMLYVGLQDNDKIVVFALDGDSGKLTKRADVAAAGGPSVMAISPDRNTLYVGCPRPIRPTASPLCPISPASRTMCWSRRKIIPAPT
jgi:hypothetical protein